MNIPLTDANQNCCPFSEIYENKQFGYCPSFIDCPIYLLGSDSFSSFCFEKSSGDTSTRQKIIESFFNLKFSVTFKPHVKISMLKEKIDESDFLDALVNIHNDDGLPLFVTSTADPHVPLNRSYFTIISGTNKSDCFHYISLLPKIKS